MALAIKKRPLVKSSSAGAAPEPIELTIEQVRDKFPLGTLPRTVAELRELQIIKDAARELTNKASRTKTVVGKAMSALVLNDTIARGDRICIGDTAYFYDYAESDSISFDELLKLFEKGEISREAFTKSCKVNKDVATKLIGAIVLEDITTHKIGDKLDIRSEDLEKPIDEPFRIVKKPKPEPKVQKSQQQPVAVSTGVSQKPVRRIRLR